jgi:hypothetical protein
MARDQAGDGPFPITQGFLAQMWGVSQPTVALSAAALQSAGLIGYLRGELPIEERLGLGEAACGRCRTKRGVGLGQGSGFASRVLC